MSESEAAVLEGILRALGRRPDLCKVSRRNRGVARNVKTGRGVRFGDFDGGADVTGILVDGRRLEIEVKSEEGRLTKQQASFARMVLQYHGVHLVARSVEQAVQAVEAAVKGRK